MSALDTTLSAVPKLVPQAPDLWAMDQPSRAAVLDSVISKNRAATPAAVEDKRAIKRLSIEELNNMDIEAIQQRWANSRFDSRDAVTKFLDVIDVPRNVLMGTLAPSLRRKAEERGDIAALGQGRVNFSDVLESMGVENRVVRGVVGFVGDVLFDPLTYAGGAGFVKAAAQSGKEVALVKKFDKAFRGTVRAMAAGGTPVDETIARYVRTAGYTPEKIAELRAAGKTPKQIEEELSALYNRRSPRWTRKQDPLRVRAQTTKADPINNTLADDIVSVGVGPNERLDAAKAIYEKYGRGSAPQLRLGRKPRVISGKAGVVDPGTGIASIPFTNLEVTIPTRFSVGARSAAVTGRLATIAKNLEAMDAAKYAPEVVAPLKAGEASLDELGRAIDELDSLGDPPPAGTVERQAYDARKSAVVQKVNDAEAGVRNASTQTTVQLAKLQPSEWAQAEKIAELSRANVLAYAAVRVRAKTAAAAKELVENIRDVRREFEAGTKSLTAKYAKEIAANSDDLSRQVLSSAERARVSKEMRSAFGNDDIMPVVDAYAKGWAKSQGKPVDDYYRTLRVESGGAPGEGALFMTAHHGTPHTFQPESLIEINGKRQYVPLGQEPEGATIVAQFPMGRFDIGKIGTGEGAQAYGHGLYFASNRSVAQYYKDVLSKGSTIFTKDGRTIDGLDAIEEYYKPGRILESDTGWDRVESFSRSNKNGGWLVTVQSVIERDGKWVNKPYEDPRTHYTAPDIRELKKVLEADGWANQSGRLYTVDLKPAEDEYLLWDKPLSEQSDKVRSALAKMDHLKFSDKATGSTIYRKVSTAGLGGNGNDAAASRELREAGIRGVKYLDGSSRSKGAGNYNYVIFDDADVSILNVEQRAPMAGAAMGSYELKSSGERIIRALTDPNASTLPHEVAHDFLANLRQMDERLAQKAAKTLGVDDFAKIGIKEHEHFARGFEAYLRTGDAPSSALKEVFNKFREFLTNIYRRIIGTPLEGKLNPELRRVFDEMLTLGDQEVDSARVIQEASKRAKAEYLVNQEEAVQNIINLSEESVRAREQYADSLHELMRMDRLVADATKGPALAMLSSKEIEQIDFAKEILGLGDSAGYGLFASIRAAAQPFAAANNYALDDSLARMSRASEVTFGNRSGWAYEIQRKYQQMANGVFGEAGQVAYDEFNTALWDIANIHAKSPSQAADMREDLGRFLYAMLDRDIAKTPLVDGAGKPTGTAKLLATMEAKGYLDDTMFPGMKNALQSLQERWGELLSNVSEFERRQGYRKTTAENYVPSTITGEASAAIRELNVSGLESSPGVSTRAATGGEQAFQQERSRYLYEWDGGAKYFTAGEREKYMAFTREQLDAIGPPGTFQRDHIDKVRAAVAEYDAMPNYLRPAPRLLDPFELNERVMNGQTFSVLTGGRKIAFYDDDAAIVLGKRLAQSERAYYDKYLFDYLDSQKVLINVEQAKVERGGILNTGDTIRLPSGAMARVESAGRDEFVFVIGGERYRRSMPMQSSIYNPYSGLENGTAFQAYYPERLSDLMERTTEVYRDEGVFQRALQSADEIQKLWKSTTLMHPSWVISNLLTFVVQAPMMGLLPTDIAAKFKTALQIIKAGRNEELLAKIAVEAGGVTRNGIDIAVTNPARDDVFTGTQSLEAIGHLLANGTFMLPPKHQLFSKGLIENPAEHVRLVMNEIKDRGVEMARADAAGSALSRMRPIEVARQAKNIVVDAGLYERLWAPFARVNAKMEQTLRLASYLALLDKGHDLVSAGRIVREHLFDMSTLTRTETQYLRRFAPFYSWLRASTVYGMRQVMHNPRYFTFPPKLKEAIEEFVNGEQDVPNYMRPSWLNETLAMQLGTDPDNRFVFNSLSLMPQESSIRALSMLGAPVFGASAAMDGLAYFGNSLTPLLKIPGEITSGREWYTQRTIGGDPNTGDLSLQEYLLGQIRPLREFGVGNVRQSPVGAAFERSPAEGVARLTVGGRIQPFTEERRLFALRRELKQREDSIRARIRISEREGAKEASLAAREELLRLYARMQEVGLGDDVPKFARRQLDQLNSGGGGGV